MIFCISLNILTSVIKMQKKLKNEKTSPIFFCFNTNIFNTAFFLDIKLNIFKPDIDQSKKR